MGKVIFVREDRSRFRIGPLNPGSTGNLGPQVRETGGRRVETLGRTPGTDRRVIERYTEDPILTEVLGVRNRPTLPQRSQEIMGTFPSRIRVEPVPVPTPVVNRLSQNPWSSNSWGPYRGEVVSLSYHCVETSPDTECTSPVRVIEFQSPTTRVKCLRHGRWVSHVPGTSRSVWVPQDPVSVLRCPLVLVRTRVRDSRRDLGQRPLPGTSGRNVKEGCRVRVRSG